MDPQLLFALAFPLAAPFWALMILAPGWPVTRRVVASPLIVVPPLLVYALAVLPALSEVLPAVASPTLAGVAGLLGTPLGAAAGWRTSSASICSWAAGSSSTPASGEFLTSSWRRSWC